MRWAKARRGVIPTRLAIAPGAARNSPDSAAPNCLMSSSAVAKRSAFQNFAIVSSAKSPCNDRATAQYCAPCAQCSGLQRPRRTPTPRRSAQILADEILHRRERVFRVYRALVALRMPRRLHAVRWAGCSRLTSAVRLDWVSRSWSPSRARLSGPQARPGVSSTCGPNRKLGFHVAEASQCPSLALG